MTDFSASLLPEETLDSGNHQMIAEQEEKKFKIKLQWACPDGKTFDKQQDALRHCAGLQLADMITNADGIYLEPYRLRAIVDLMLKFMEENPDFVDWPPLPPAIVETST